MSGFVTRLPCTRAEADRLARLDEALGDQDPPPVLVASEGARGWVLALYTDERPTPGLLAAFAALAPSARAAPVTEPLHAPVDWVTLSQQGMDRVAAGRFLIVQPDGERGPRPRGRTLVVPAARAFGTGHHATTRGMLLMLQAVLRGRRPHRLLDLGTGTGVLALAAHRLSPQARILATDIDPHAVAVAQRTARANGIAAIRYRTAFGVADPAIARAAPFDLVLANILAAPLLRLAPSLAPLLGRGGLLLLAGLLAPQRARLLARYRAHGLVKRAERGGEWPVLVLEQTRPASPATSLRRARRGTAADRRLADSA